VVETRTYAATGVAKSFSGVTVLQGVDFEIRAGEVHALLGENGSGKSTLINLLGGVHRPTAGNVTRDGEAIALASPADARRFGLAIVHQDYQLFPTLSIAANIGLGGSLFRHRGGFLDRRALRRAARDALETVGLAIDPSRPLGTLRLAEWKLVEVARAIAARSSFLVFDEPTALLDRNDSARILELIERLRQEGVGVAFVSHRLDEALRVADVATVLRDGRRVATLPRERLSHERLVTLAVRAGEIVGLTGLIGSGAIEAGRMIAGRQALDGVVRVRGRATAIGSPAAAIRAGIGYIPEERGTHGQVAQLSVEVNMSLASLANVSPRGVLNRRGLRRRAEQYARDLAIRAPSLQARIATLSGGNQQKVQIAKWLAAKPNVLVIESPTHGVDVGAKLEIHRLLLEFAAAGGAVIVASTDIPETVSIADRVAVFSRGDLVEIVGAAETSHRQVLLSGTRAPELDEIEALIAT
jgi:ABC-type sugar transport system ATPase subunit